MAKEEKKNDNRVIDMRSVEQKVADKIQERLFKDSQPDRQLKGIDLCFENVEAYSISAEDIVSFWFGNIQHDLSFDGARSRKDRFMDGWHCDSLDMVLDFNAINKIKTWQSSNGDLDHEENRYGLADRILQFNDLVNIDLHFTDGSHQNVYLKYDDPFSEDQNLRMSTAVGQDREAKKLLYIYVR